MSNPKRSSSQPASGNLPTSGSSGNLQKSDSKVSRESSTAAMCKICHCGVSEASLISPCRCKGTMSYSHPDCVMKWVNHSNKTKCEICKTKYNLKKVGYRPMNEWRMVEVTCDELLHLMLLGCSLIIMLGSILWWKFVFHGHADGYSKFFNSDSMRMMVYITYGPLNGLCLLLALLEIKLVLMPIISRWKMLNQEIVVLPYSSRSKSLTDYTSTNSTSGSRTTVDPRDVTLELRRSASVQTNPAQSVSNPSRQVSPVRSSMQRLLPSNQPPRRLYPQLLSDNRLAGRLPTTPSSHLYEPRATLHTTRSLGALDQLYKRGQMENTAVADLPGTMSQIGKITSSLISSNSSFPQAPEIINLSDTASTNRGLMYRPDINSIEEEQIRLYLPAGTEAIFTVKNSGARSRKENMDNDIMNLYKFDTTRL